MNINDKNMIKILVLLNNYFSNNSVDKLAEVEYPEEIEYGTNEWLCYIFYSCLLDYGMRSKVYHNNLIHTYHSHKNIFKPNYVIDNFKNDSSELVKIIKENIHPRYPNIAVKKWLTLSEKLNEFDNLLDKIKEFKNIYEVYFFIQSIHCYGQKTGGLLLRLIYESNICKFFDDIFIIPIDRHDLEISYLNGVVDTIKLNSKQIRDLSLAYVKTANKLGIKPDNIDKYLWEIGNKFCDKKDCVHCPLYSNCAKKL